MEVLVDLIKTPPTRIWFLLSITTMFIVVIFEFIAFWIFDESTLDYLDESFLPVAPTMLVLVVIGTFLKIFARLLGLITTIAFLAGVASIFI